MVDSKKVDKHHRHHPDLKDDGQEGEYRMLQDNPIAENTVVDDLDDSTCLPIAVKSHGQP